MSASRVEVTASSRTPGTALAKTTVTDRAAIDNLRSALDDLRSVMPGTYVGSLPEQAADVVWLIEVEEPGGRTWAATTTRAAKGEETVVSVDGRALGPPLAASPDRLIPLLNQLTGLSPDHT